MKDEVSPGQTQLSVLVVCTGNQCRSPMAAAMLERDLGQRSLAVRVESAGFVSEGAPCPPEVDKVMAALGYDLSGHRSRMVGESVLESADLVIGMTRQHLIDISLTAPPAKARAFTLVELVNLAERAGPRQPGERLPAWLSRVGASRNGSSVLNLPLSDDIPDPIGRPLAAYVRTRDLLAGLCSRLAERMASV